MKALINMFLEPTSTEEIRLFFLQNETWMTLIEFKLTPLHVQCSNHQVMAVLQCKTTALLTPCLSARVKLRVSVCVPTSQDGRLICFFDTSNISEVDVEGVSCREYRERKRSIDAGKETIIFEYINRHFTTA